MQIIKRMPIPIYEIECQECGSVIHFRAAESQRDRIACPVCGVTVWTMNARKLEGHADPSGEPGPRGVPCSTNANRIRAMTDEELAEWLDNIDTAYEPETVVSRHGWLDWLRQEVADEHYHSWG